LSLPNLDDLRWEDLLEEGRTLIPAWAPEWTNHNPSDPGITLIELFAYFSEKLMYQLNRVGDKNVVEFLKLINGPQWESKGKLTEERRTAVRELRKPRRAVSAEDFEMLTQAVAGVARAKCIARRNLEVGSPDAHTADAPGHVSVAVVPKSGSHPSRELLAKVKREIEPARLLTTRIHVVGPRYVSLKFRLVVVPRRGTPARMLRDAAIKRLKIFFDPLKGGRAKEGEEGKGWPFGGNVYVSELYRVLGDLPEMESVMPARDSSGTPLDELVVEAGEAGRLRRNSRGEVEAVALQPDELVEAQIDGSDISTPPHV